MSPGGSAVPVVLVTVLLVLSLPFVLFPDDVLLPEEVVPLPLPLLPPLSPVESVPLLLLLVLPGPPEPELPPAPEFVDAPDESSVSDSSADESSDLQAAISESA